METSINKIALSGKTAIFSIDVADFVIIMAAIFFGLIIFHWIGNHVSSNLKKFGGAYRTMVMILFYGLIFLVVLNGIVNRQYSNLFVLIFLFLAPKLNKWYTAYDKYINQHV